MQRLIRHLGRVCRNQIELEDCEFRPATHWGMPDCYRAALPKGLIDLPPGALEWLRDRGCITRVSNNQSRIVITPKIYVEPPAICHHATPFENKENIKTNGVKCGRLAGKSTTEWRDAAEFIHVCFSRKECQHWINTVFPMGGIGAAQWWAIFEIDMSRFSARVS